MKNYYPQKKINTRLKLIIIIRIMQARQKKMMKIIIINYLNVTILNH